MWIDQSPKHTTLGACQGCASACWTQVRWAIKHRNGSQDDENSDSCDKLSTLAFELGRGEDEWSGKWAEVTLLEQAVAMVDGINQCFVRLLCFALSGVRLYRSFVCLSFFLSFSLSFFLCLFSLFLSFFRWVFLTYLVCVSCCSFVWRSNSGLLVRFFFAFLSHWV